MPLRSPGTPKARPCAVCGKLPSSRPSLVVIERRAVPLCAEHASRVALALPETFEDLRALFRAETRYRGGPDRRSALPRRGEAERRLFPRIEGRRMAIGRRAGDAPDAPDTLDAPDVLDAGSRG